MGLDRALEHRSDVLDRWAASGAMLLTGHRGRATLGPPDGLVEGLDRLAGPFAGLDPLRLVTERAAWASLERGGRTTCGGAGRLMRASDGWLAVSLARPDDIELVPAWLANTDGEHLMDPAMDRSTGLASTAMWDEIAVAVKQQSVTELEGRAAMLGMAIAGLGTASAREPILRSRLGSVPSVRDTFADLLVVDLSALWAGPLCGALLAEAGATVVKVESVTRPDGARQGPAGFYDRLNGAKASVALDLSEPSGVAALRRLLDRADVVIESSRPRAMNQLGIDPSALLTNPATALRVWVSITAHGRGGDPVRVGFGDDAAVAGGLVSFDEANKPVFCADAIADPCTGLAAAGATLDALATEGRWMLDVSMSAVAASLAGPTLAVPDGLVASAPTTPPTGPRARSLGADTAAVLANLEAPR